MMVVVAEVIMKLVMQDDVNILYGLFGWLEG